MTCFNCGKVGEKTGHDGCKNPTTPNEAGIKAKDAYRKKLLEKKKKKKSSTMGNIDEDSSDSESDSDNSSEMCMITQWETDDASNTDDDNDTPPDLVPLSIILLPGYNKLAIFQDVIINSQAATVMFDTGALGNGGNWITDSTATRLGAFLEPTKKKAWKSPLFPDAKFVSKTKTTLSLLFSSFGFEIQHVEFRVMEASSMKAHIILGLQFIEQYDIMSYLTNPDRYNAVYTPPPAEEESLD